MNESLAREVRERVLVMNDPEVIRVRRSLIEEGFFPTP
jgi:hypothetical protein